MSKEYNYLISWSLMFNSVQCAGDSQIATSDPIQVDMLAGIRAQVTEGARKAFKKQRPGVTVPDLRQYYSVAGIGGPMSIIKYRTGHNHLIERIEIARETERFIYKMNGVKEHKSTFGAAYFDSFEDAKAFLIDRQMTGISNVERQLARLKHMLALIEACTEATDVPAVPEKIDLKL